MMAPRQEVLLNCIIGSCQSKKRNHVASYLVTVTSNNSQSSLSFTEKQTCRSKLAFHKTKMMSHIFLSSEDRWKVELKYFILFPPAIQTMVIRLIIDILAQVLPSNNSRAIFSSCLHLTSTHRWLCVFTCVLDLYRQQLTVELRKATRR